MARLQGNALATMWISSETNHHQGGHLISYKISAFKKTFQNKRMIRAELTEGDLLSFNKDALSMTYKVESGAAGGVQPRIETGTLHRRGAYEYLVAKHMHSTYYPCAVALKWTGMYEYTISSKMPSDTAYDVWCGQNGASLLTIYDNQELRFVVENIMRPLKVEHIFAEITRPVSHILQLQTNSAIQTIFVKWQAAKYKN